MGLKMKKENAQSNAFGFQKFCRDKRAEDPKVKYNMKKLGQLWEDLPTNIQNDYKNPTKLQKNVKIRKNELSEEDEPIKETKKPLRKTTFDCPDEPQEVTNKPI